MNAAGVPTAVHYPMPLHQQPAVADVGCQAPDSELAAKEVISLPMHPYLEEAEIEQVVDALSRAISHCA